MTTSRGVPPGADDGPINTGTDENRNPSKKNKRKKNTHETDNSETDEMTSKKTQVAEKIVLQPQLQVWVKSTTQHKGEIITGPKPTLCDGHLVTTTNGMAHVRQNAPFKVLVGHQNTLQRHDAVLRRG